ncbi:unnamed protein product [marine sediment metagenome]|uniref:Uncharacterized protein n=1 Tax=marine sediment metagenome TaxID=412755 RepID=X0VU59_9ZZZZ
MAKHTQELYEADIQRNRHVVTGNGCVVADCGPDFADPHGVQDAAGAANEAHARLFAKAPELAKLCATLIDGLDDYWITLPEGKAALATAQALLAEIEGA